MRTAWPVLLAVALAFPIATLVRPAAPAARPEAPIPATAAAPQAPNAPEAAPAPRALPPTETPAESAALPVPPSSARGRPELLRDWLLNLPAGDLGRLAGTPRLDGYVASVVDAAMAEAGDDGPRQIDLFLAQLNRRIIETR